MNSGKMETISRLAGWRVGRVDCIGPWEISWLGSWSYCFSNTFKMGRWNWSLAIAKNNNNNNNNNNQVRIGLRRKASSFEWKEQSPTARFVLRVLESQPGRSPLISPVHETQFPPDYYSMPVDYTPNGPFIVDIEFLDLRTSDAVVGRSEVWPNEVMIHSLATKSSLGCLSHRLQEGIHTDVTINTPNGMLKAHKAVLSASSPVFKSMFLHDLKEKETSTIDIEDMSSESCEVLLSYMYGTINQGMFSKERLPLLAAADKYGIIDLKDYCEESLLEDICSSNVLERLRYASLHQLDKLKKKCFMYLFDFGKVYDVRDEIDSFFVNADSELKSQMFKEMMKVWKPECLYDMGGTSNSSQSLSIKGLIEFIAEKYCRNINWLDAFILPDRYIILPFLLGLGFLRL